MRTRLAVPVVTVLAAGSLLSPGANTVRASAFTSPVSALPCGTYGGDSICSGEIFQPGHSIRLDLQQSDNPTYRPGNPGATAAVTFGSPTLSLPIRDTTNEVIAGA